jgi:hypothetical protein
MKGQLTLETIIMLVVLLVLAGVMITLILTTLKPPSSPEKVLSKQEFLSMCENYCNNPEKTVDYCRAYWNGRDWNNNNVPSELIQVGSYNWYACEDRIYCFLVKPCDRLGTGIELLEKCRDLLCGTYVDKYGSADIATDKLKQDISFSTRCSFSNVPNEENWYARVFEQGCVGGGGTGGTTPGGSVSLQNCNIDTNAKKIECLTNCKSASLLVVTGKDKSGNDLTISGSPSIAQGKVSLTDSKLGNINCTQDINVVLSCENPDATGMATGSCLTSSSSGSGSSGSPGPPPTLPGG